MVRNHPEELLHENNAPPQNVVVEAQKTSIEAQKDSVEAQKTSIEAQKDSIEAQKDSIEAQKDSIEAQKDSIETQKDSIEAQKDSIEAQIDSIETNTGNIEIEYDNENIKTSPEIVFNCSKCNRSFARLTNCNRHMVSCNGITDPLICIYCNKSFNHTSSKYRHQKTCPSQFTMLLNSQCNQSVQNQQSQQSQVVPVNANNVISSQSGSINNGTVNNHNQNHINNGTVNNNNNTYHIHINNLGKERMDHITPEFIAQCIRMNSHLSICEMFDKVHRNPDIPENQNVRIMSKRDELMHVFKNDRWTIQDKNATLDEITDIYINLLRTFYLNNEELRQEDIDRHEYALHRKLSEIQAKKPFRNHSDLRKRLFSSIMDMGKLNGYRVEMKLVPIEAENVGSIENGSM